SLALYELIKQGIYDITLLTTITEEYGRISMHGVREALLEKQARSLGCHLEKVYLTPESTNEEYEEKIEQTLNRYKSLGVTKMAFGDIFLADIRDYREKNLEKIGIQPVFPLWGTDTKELAHTFIDLNFKAVVTCIDTTLLNGEFAGRLYDQDLLADLPEAIDPCGENGEFHSFVYGGPIFRETINFTVGEKVLRDNRYNFCDLL
ncbi:MAG: ATP-binding protein, partial [Ignavibacteriales bacterium]